MNDVVIYIDWPYFLGIIGGLIGIAYYTNGRFTRLETSVDWIIDALRELKTRLQDSSNPAHESD